MLTKSTKLKASQRNAGLPVKNNSNLNLIGGGQKGAKDDDDFSNKNYILCHVRRVMGKRDEEFDTEEGEAGSPVKKEGA